jgi:hypothetical protein
MITEGLKHVLFSPTYSSNHNRRYFVVSHTEWDQLESSTPSLTYGARGVGVQRACAQCGGRPGGTASGPP